MYDRRRIDALARDKITELAMGSILFTEPDMDWV
jgi:hypothetical protein